MSVQEYDLRILFWFSVFTLRRPWLLWFPAKRGFALRWGDPVQTKFTFFIKLEGSNELGLFINLEHPVAALDKSDDVIPFKFKEVRQPKPCGFCELVTDSVAVNLPFVVYNRPDALQDKVGAFNQVVRS